MKERDRYNENLMGSKPCIHYQVNKQIFILLQSSEKACQCLVITNISTSQHKKQVTKKGKQ